MSLPPLPFTHEEVAQAFATRDLRYPELGRGSFKVVYLAQDDTGSVIKILTEALGEEVDATDVDDAILPERFARELRGMQLADSPFIGRILVAPQAVSIGDHRYIVYEEPFYAGGTLKDRLGKGPLDAVAAQELVVALLHAVRELWSHEIVHRDIKPGNIMFDDAGAPVLIDLGISLHRDLDDLTDSEDFSPNTVGYSAPEQHKQKRFARLDFRTDLFLVGIIGYYAVAGVHPLLEQGMSRQKYIGRLVTFDQIPVESLQCSDELRAVLGRLLAPSPNRRYRTVEEPLEILGAL